MSHQFETGFFVRTPAWHNLGTVVNDYPGSVEEARKLAGLDWDPIEESTYDLVGVGADGQPHYEAIEGFKQIKRSDTGARLTIAKGTYTVLGNEVPFQIAEAVLEAGKETGREVKYETAICLDGGRRVAILVNLGDTMLPGDPSPHTKYMYVATSHDGSAALRAGGTDVRVVCANTEAAADSDSKAKGTFFTFNHTKNIMARVDEAKAVLLGVYDDVEKVYDRAREMLEVKITARQREAFVRGFAIERAIRTSDVKAATLAAKLEHPRIIKTIEATMTTLNQILDSDTCTGISGTAYGLTQGAIELLDHFRPTKSEETLFTRTMIDREPQKALAYKVAGQVLATV